MERYARLLGHDTFLDFCFDEKSVAVADSSETAGGFQRWLLYGFI